MHRITVLNVLDNHNVELTFADGVHGVVDLSIYVGKGIFSAWEDEQFFRSAHIGSAGDLIWSDEIGLCPDALYMQITGKSPEEVFPAIKREDAHA